MNLLQHFGEGTFVIDSGDFNEPSPTYWRRNLRHRLWRLQRTFSSILEKEPSSSTLVTSTNLLQHSGEGTFVNDSGDFYEPSPTFLRMNLRHQLRQLQQTFSNILEKEPSSMTWATSTNLLQHSGEGTLVNDLGDFSELSPTLWRRNLRHPLR